MHVCDEIRWTQMRRSCWTAHDHDHDESARRAQEPAQEAANGASKVEDKMSNESDGASGNIIVPALRTKPN